MALRNDLDWLTSEVEKHGSLRAAADANSVARSTFRDACERVGLKRRGSGVSNTKRPTTKPSVGETVSREEILEHENLELRRQVKAARKLEVFDARALAVLEHAVDSLEPDFVPVAFPADSTKTTHAHVLQWSDLHAAERVSYEAMNGLNEFNWPIMLQRLNTVQQAVVSFKRTREYPIDELHILGLGDQVTGDIHDELRETNEVVCTEAAVKLGLDSAEWIAGFAPYYKRIFVSGVVGNHGRLGKPEFKNAHKNWDWIAYKIMELRLAEFENIRVEVPKTFEHLVQVFDKNIVCFHGDGIQSSMVGVPWGGITRRVKEMFQTWMATGVKVDHWACGHWHEANVVNQKGVWVNGSIKGQDEYSRKRFGGGQPPCQLLHTFHPVRGLVTTDWIMA